MADVISRLTNATTDEAGVVQVLVESGIMGVEPRPEATGSRDVYLTSRFPLPAGTTLNVQQWNTAIKNAVTADVTAMGYTVTQIILFTAVSKL